ncbi:hypothetical protein PMAYCL1PPCAC_20789, partial [Pristionchus mayeri]
SPSDRGPSIGSFFTSISFSKEYGWKSTRGSSLSSFKGASDPFSLPGDIVAKSSNGSSLGSFIGKIGLPINIAAKCACTRMIRCRNRIEGDIRP